MGWAREERGGDVRNNHQKKKREKATEEDGGEPDITGLENRPRARRSIGEKRDRDH